MPLPENTADQRAKARRYESNFRHFGRGLAMHAGGVCLKEAGVEVYATPFHIIFSAFLPPRWATKHCARNLRTVLRLGARTGQGLGVIVGPSANAEELRRQLVDMGVKCGFWVPFMHRDLQQPIPRASNIPGLRIEVVEDLSVFDERPHPYIGSMTTAKRRAEREYHQVLCRRGRARQLIAWWEGEPVGATLLYPYRGAAGIYDVGVLKSHRGRGIGQALVRTALHEARAWGMECAVLSAATRAVPLYQRIGFTDAGRYGSYHVGREKLRRWARGSRTGDYAS